MTTYIDDAKIRFDEVSAPATPAAGKVVLYAKTDGLLYSKNDTGAEKLLGGSLSTSSKTINAWLELDATALVALGKLDHTFSGDGLTCRHLDIWALVRTNEVDAVNFFDQIYLFFNNDTTVTNYYRQNLFASSAAVATNVGNTPLSGNMPNNSSDANNFGFIRIEIPDYRGTSKEKIAKISYAVYSTTSIMYNGHITLQWNNAAAISRITLQTVTDPTTQLAIGSQWWIYGSASLSVLTSASFS